MKAEQVMAPVAKELDLVRDSLREAATAGFPECAPLFSQMVNNTGKGLRPALTLMSGKLYNYDLDVLIPMAKGVELLHIASLVHDDIVDDAPMRRGLAYLGESWNPDSAMLVGDYLFAKSAEIVSTTENLEVIKLFAQTLMRISEGQLFETLGAYKPRSRQDYFSIISAKTASLFELATKSGAVLGGAPSDKVEALKDYGHNIGMAFQIRDDILDFVSSEQEMGKPVKNDLPRGNVTLPALLYMEKHPDDGRLRSALQRRDTEALRQAAVDVSASPAIDESRDIAAGYAESARRQIAVFPDCAPRKALAGLVDYVMTT
ncbi:MAG: polyprenyl synthetase family protein [Chloroflexota bacterium]